MFHNKYTITEIEKYFQLGSRCYSGSGFPIDRNQAFMYFDYCANLGYTNAMNICAIMLYSGDGVLQNKKKALELIKKSLNEGNTNAMRYYGLMLKNGDCGLKKNDKEAEKFFRIADIGSDPKNAFYYAGELEKNSYIEEAILFYKMALQNGYTEASEKIKHLELKLKELNNLNSVNNEFSDNNKIDVA